MKSRVSKLALESPRAFESLTKQLSLGNAFKSFVVKVLLEFGRFRFLRTLPLLGDLILTAEGLLCGHIAEVEIVEKIKSSSVSQSVFPKLSEGIPREVDVLIVGSGPGAVVSADLELRKGDRRIHILERGNLPRTPHSLHHSLTHLIQDFNQGGQEFICAAGFPLFAQANVVGGGSEVNSGLYHNLPSHYLHKYSVAFSTSEEEWIEAERRTFELLKPTEMIASPEFSLLARGAGQINLNFKNIPRWRTYSPDGSFNHRGMNEIYWNEKTHASEITLSSGLEVTKISIRNPEYIEVSLRNLVTQSESVIRARRIHLCAGAISSPALLAKSGLIQWRDTRFSWHPMIRIVASTKEMDLGIGDIDPFQAWTEDLSLKFGSAVSTAPLLSIALGRTVNSKELANLRSYYVSFSSTGRGGLLPLFSLPWYTFSKLDKKLARDGLDLLKSIIIAGGGQLLNSEKLNYKKFSTVHIFGTLPIGSDVFIPGTNRLKIDGRIKVSDASLLPFSPSVNPQGIVMTAVRVANEGYHV